MSSKTIHTIQDIKAVLFMIDFVKKAYFPSATKITSKHYLEIHVLSSEIGRKISESTISRIFKLKRNPSKLTYDKLDDFTYWCYSGEFFNFEEFVNEKKHEIENANLVNKKELKFIFDEVNKKQTTLVKKTQSINLGNEAIQLNLSEGSVTKLLNVVAPILGDLITQEIIKKPELMKRFNHQRIDNRLFLKEKRRQNNIEIIVKKALKYARNIENSESSVDLDWIVDFFDIAQDCTNKNMQYLWAKLLAEEIAEPKTFSRRTLAAIKLINPYEAQIFTLLCNCVWDFEESHFGREKMLIKDMDSNGRYSDTTWKFNGSFISHLEEVGLVYDSFVQLDKKRIYSATFFGKKHKLKPHFSEQQVDVVALTQVGLELFKIVNPEPNNDYYEITLDYFKEEKILKS